MRRVGWVMPFVVLAGCVGSSGGASAPTAPVPTKPSVAAVTTLIAATTTAPVTTVSETTVPATTVADTTAPPTTAGTTSPSPPSTAVAGRVAITGDPFLVDIPGKMIDYVPDVAAKAGINVPGQYYEILPKFFVFIPSQRSDANRNMQPPDPEDKPLVEAYVRALSSLWSAFLSDPVPANGTPEMRAAYTDKGFQPNLPILEKQAKLNSTTVIRGGNISVPWVQADRRSNSFGQVLDCGWQDQYDVEPGGTTKDDYDKPNPLRGDMVEVDGVWLADALVKADWACV